MKSWPPGLTPVSVFSSAVDFKISFYIMEDGTVYGNDSSSIADARPMRFDLRHVIGINPH